MYGWGGYILKAYLTDAKVIKDPLSLEFARAFLGGRGFNSKIIYDGFDPSVTDPFSPKNIVAISPGSLCGNTLSASRICVSVARSPVTRVFGDGNLGSYFGGELKWAGYDSIVFYGKAKDLVYLRIEDDRVELRDARHLKGKMVSETDAILKEELGDPDARVIAIGPAGENQVASAIPLELHRAAGACGTGGVLGSKNVKAIVVRGTRGSKIARPNDLKEAFKKVHKKLLSGPHYPMFSTYGSASLLDLFNESGMLPTYNWQDREVEGVEKVYSTELKEKYGLKMVACLGCAVHCEHYYVVKEGPYATKGAGAEYEVTCGFGPRAGGVKLDAILYINTLLNDLGLDVVQVSNWINTMRHWWQDGLIDESDTDGLVFEWGDYDSTIEAIRRLAYRKGKFGNSLAGNIFTFARSIADKKKIPVEKLTRYLIQIKGMTQSSGDNRLMGIGAALSHGTSTRGSDHLRGVNTDIWLQQEKAEDIWGIPREVAQRFLDLGLSDMNRYEGKEEYVAFMEDYCAVTDSLGICKRHTAWEGMGLGLEEMAEYLNAVTGMNYTWKDLRKCGTRIYNVERAMQARYGLRRKDDFPPVRFFEEPVPSGPLKGAILDRKKFDKLLSAYYRHRGWNEEGIPLEETLKDLGLEDISRDLKKRKIIQTKKAGTR
ncbi:MAG: aldehyde ferredoxin oxidoreductase family protein [Deltaproteobacteria bacterium]|nr:aldehyde ferredoxin oxidoreductase family protein [Deltaproteobacteria bacterium]MBW1977544.1 aldehyde ferredoxin oxidoreductase family protein [Deltaproteobacteria bacterium]MBW2299502.1 aldehyde ferredoxin oxidoreductase family protein [Deltaproteobacteria bacterium]